MSSPSTAGALDFLNCSRVGTRLIINATTSRRCDCFGGFYGETCEDVFAYFVPLNWTLFVVTMVALSSLGIWAVIRFVHNIAERRGKRAAVATLAMASQVMLFAAIILRMTHQVMQSQGRLLNYAELAPLRLLTLGRTIISNGVTALMMASTSLIIGFWFNLAISKMRLRAAKVTRIVCIVSAFAVLIIDSVGFALIVVFNENTPVTTTIVVAPLVLTVVVYLVAAIYLFVVTSRAAREGAKNNNEYTTRRQVFVRKAVLALALLWIFAIALGAVGGSMSSSVGLGTTSNLVIWVFQAFELAIIFVVQLMLSRKRAPWTLVRELISGDFSSGSIRTSSGSGNSTETPMTKSSKSDDNSKRAASSATQSSTMTASVEEDVS